MFTSYSGIFCFMVRNSFPFYDLQYSDHHLLLFEVTRAMRCAVCAHSKGESGSWPVTGLVVCACVSSAVRLDYVVQLGAERWVAQWVVCR